MKLQPTITPKQNLWLAPTLIFLVMTAWKALDPQTERPKGRGEFLFGLLWDASGPIGIAAFWGALALFCAIQFFLNRDTK